jgi:hypothetical protein
MTAVDVYEGVALLRYASSVASQPLATQQLFTTRLAHALFCSSHGGTAPGSSRPFGRLVDQVMTTEPYASAQQVSWVVDNGSSHHGQASVDPPQSAWPNLS